MPVGDSRGVPVVQFDPAVEISPFVLFRRLREGRAVQLVDIRTVARVAATLEGCERKDPGWIPTHGGDGPPGEIVLVDDDGTASVARVRELHAAGFPSVRALFGGLDLWLFSLDPEIVGEDTFLRTLSEE